MKVTRRHEKEYKLTALLSFLFEITLIDFFIFYKEMTLINPLKF